MPPAPASELVSAKLFGDLEVHLPGAVLGPRDLGGAKPKQLLEMLLLERGRTLAKDWLADRLWGEDLPESVPATIETYISVLRRRLGPTRELITTAAGGYRLEAGGVALDVDAFDRLLQLGAEGEPADRYPHLAEAVAMAGAPLLTDEPYAEWLLPLRARYEDRRDQALIELAECCMALGRYREGTETAGAVAARNPLLERAARMVMLGRVALGDRAGALGAYADLRAALATEYDVVPTAETTRLAAAIREGASLEALTQSVPGRQPAIRFAVSGPARIAFQTYGAGDTDLVFVPQFMSSLAATWDEPVYSSFLHRLGTLARVTLFDKRGSGLSDPVFEWPTPEERSDDIAAVMDAAGIERGVLFGVCDGGATCLRFAERHPDRVAGLVLFASPVRLLAGAGFEAGWSERFYQRFLDSFDAAWTSGAGLEAMDPSIAHDPRYRALFARFLRLGVSPGLARRLWEADGRTLDVRPILPNVAAPALVLTRSGDPWVRPEQSRQCAEGLPRGTLVELPGQDHEPWLGDPEPVLEQLRLFVAGVAAPAGSR